MMSKAELKKFNAMLTFEDPRLPQMFSALGDENRCRIFRLIQGNASDRFCVSDIAHVLRISVPTASHHLKILEKSGLLLRLRAGKMVYYRVHAQDRLVNIIRKAIQ